MKDAVEKKDWIESKLLEFESSMNVKPFWQKNRRRARERKREDKASVSNAH